MRFEHVVAQQHGFGRQTPLRDVCLFFKFDVTVYCPSATDIYLANGEWGRRPRCQIAQVGEVCDADCYGGKTGPQVSMTCLSGGVWGSVSGACDGE